MYVVNARNKDVLIHERLRGSYQASPKQKTAYLNYILSVLANHVKSNPISNLLILQVHRLNKLKTFILLKI